MDKKGVMVEEWKARRKEWKKKRRRKRGKGKSGFGKSPFCFCLTVSLPLPFFSLHPPHHHNTRSHSPTTQHDALVHTITCKQGRVLCCLFFFHNQFCGLLPVNLLAACQPHSLKRERWGLSRYGLMPGHVE